MVERGQEPRLALEARHAVAVRRHVVGKDLERDVAPEAFVPGAVDLAHPALAERARDLVRPHTRAGGQHGTIVC